jgi:hypothetical protein
MKAAIDSAREEAGRVHIFRTTRPPLLPRRSPAVGRGVTVRVHSTDAFGRRDAPRVLKKMRARHPGPPLSPALSARPAQPSAPPIPRRDGRTAFTGGMNIGTNGSSLKARRSWRDRMSASRPGGVGMAIVHRAWMPRVEAESSCQLARRQAVSVLVGLAPFPGWRWLGAGRDRRRRGKAVVTRPRTAAAPRHRGCGAARRGVDVGCTAGAATFPWCAAGRPHGLLGGSDLQYQPAVLHRRPSWPTNTLRDRLGNLDFRSSNARQR